MILYKLNKNNNSKMENAYGKYYARPVITQTIGLSDLADHMAEHNTGFSPGAVQGLLTDMVRCIKELVLKGIAVKIDNLAIFSLGIRTKKGAASEEEFSVAKNVAGVKLRARATGELTNSKLNLQANLKNAATLVEESSSTPSSPSSKDDSSDKGDGGGTSQKPSEGSGSSSSGSQGGNQVD